MEIVNKRTLGMECTHCETEFTFEAHDYKRTIFGTYYVICPCCEKKIDFGVCTFKDILNRIDISNLLSDYLFK